MVQFFVPDGNGNPLQDEELYAKLASVARGRPEPHDRRIESITWTSKGEEWTAAVGQTLRGVKETYRPPSRGGTKTERLSDPARVLAIFSGDPYRVVTNVGPGARGSAWVNPILTTQSPSDIEYFDAPQAAEPPTA